MHRPRRLALAALLALAACGGGDPGSREAVSTAVGAPEPLFDERVAHRDQGYEEAVHDAVDSIEAFWADRYPSVYGVEHRELAGLVAMAPGDEATCGDARRAYRDVKGRVSYCEPDDRILYDDARLLPELHDNFGDLALGAVLARGWGRAVQARSGFGEGHPAALVDLQADCLAGAWLGHARATGAVPDPSVLDAAVAGFLLVRDRSPSGSDATVVAAVDRLRSVRDGVDGGVGACTAYADPAVAPVALPVAPGDRVLPAGDGGDEWRDTVVDALDVFWTARVPGFEPIGGVGGAETDDGRWCGTEAWSRHDAELASYCAVDHRVVHTSRSTDALARVLGSGAVVTALADAWARAAAVALGFTADAAASGLVIDCLAGASVGGLLGVAGEPASLRSSPAILDGAVSTVLVVERLRDERLGGLARAGAFRAGFDAIVHDRSGPADACRPFL